MAPDLTLGCHAGLQAACRTGLGNPEKEQIMNNLTILILNSYLNGGKFNLTIVYCGQC